MAVNLSWRYFDDDRLIADVGAILEETGMPARQLEFEIHESVLIRDVEEALCVLSWLRTLGVRIAVDGLGSGYTSLTTLQRFPLDTVKIDKVNGTTSA